MSDCRAVVAAVWRWRPEMARITAPLAPAALAVTLVVAPPVRADATDDQFVEALTSRGVAGDQGRLVADAHQLCDAARQIGDHDSTAATSWRAAHDDIVAQVGDGRFWEVAHDAATIECSDAPHLTVHTGA
jgi:hypothetical protein